MFFFPSSGFGRFLVIFLLFSTLVYIVLNLVSFGGNPWIQYRDVPVRFGLWEVCQRNGTSLCFQWSDDIYLEPTLNVTFPNRKPTFVRSSQALEIISLIFYIIGAFVSVAGLFMDEKSLQKMMFLAASVLLFICIVFLSASLGLMSDQGRANHPGSSLEWAWWNGLFGLIFLILAWFTLIGLLLYIHQSSEADDIPKLDNNLGQYPNFSMNMNPIQPWTNFLMEPNYLHHNSLVNPWYNNGLMFDNNTLPTGSLDPNQSAIFSNILRDYFYRVNDLQYARTILPEYY